MLLLIRNGRVIDPKNNIDRHMDILIEDDVITRVADCVTEQADVTIDAKNMWVTPGLIDLHVHLREPGFVYKESIATGAKSAAAGGFTTICAMPNTNPVADTPETVRFIREKAEKESVVHVLPVGSITMKQAGEQLVDFDALVEAGVCAFSEDGKSVLNETLMALALEAAERLDIPVLSHCEDLSLVKGGVMHDGPVSKALGLPGISRESEEIIIARDLRLARQTGAKLHICHVSTGGGVALIREAGKTRPGITCEACPHHFTLTDTAISGKDTNFKMNPPLREQADVDAILEGLRDGTISVIATDHAPHSPEDKRGGFLKAAHGIVGLETAVALCVTKLVLPGVLTPLQLIEKLTVNPARVLGIDKGSLSPGACADVTVIDPAASYVIDPASFCSKSKNSPFGGMRVSGAVSATIVSGRIVYDRRSVN